MKLLWIDDHASLCDALAMASSDTRVGLQWLQASTLAEARSRLEREPEVVLVVADLAVIGGFDGIIGLREATPSAALIALSADERRGTVMGAISAGASGFIVKTAAPGVMATAVRLALAGGIPLPISLLERRAPDRPGYGTWTPTPRGPEALGFLPDEAEVLQRLVQGQSEMQIARSLSIEASTLKARMDAVLRKLDAGSRSQAVLAAAHLGLQFGPL